MITLFNLRPNTPNIGNDLIALGMQSAVQSILGRNVNLVSLPASNSMGPKGAGLTAKTVYEINRLADGLVVGPGNLFENGALTIDLGALKALHVPTMLFSVSTGRVFDRTGQLAPRTDSMSPDKMATICNMARPVLVRDAATKDHLSNLGCDHARIMGCPALLLGNTPFASLPADPSLSNSVLISLRHPTLMSIPYSAQGRVHHEVRSLIHYCQGQRLDVKLLCHDYQDLSFAQMFPEVPALYTEDPYRFLSWLRSCRLNITFRLHAFIGCLAVGTPSIPFSYDERSLSLIDTIGMSEWAICFLRSRDVLADVKCRWNALERLEELRSLAQPTWDKLRNVMTQGIEDFASQVKCRAAAVCSGAEHVLA